MPLASNILLIHMFEQQQPKKKYICNHIRNVEQTHAIQINFYQHTNEKKASNMSMIYNNNTNMQQKRGSTWNATNEIEIRKML